MKKLIVTMLLIVFFCPMLLMASSPTYPVSIPVRMVVPWYVEVSPVSPIILAQEDGPLGRSFQGCGHPQFSCNFNFYLKCEVTDVLFAGNWKCWFQNPGKYIS